MSDVLNVNKMPSSSCPVCEAPQNAATQIENEAVRPQPGDFSLCFNCGASLRFGEQLELELAPPFDELVARGEITAATRRQVEHLQARIRARRGTS